MKFSERKGFSTVSKIIEKDRMSDSLRASLWNALDMVLWPDTMSSVRRGVRGGTPRIVEFARALWFEYFKEPIDYSPAASSDKNKILAAIRKHFFHCEWYQVYDFLEYTLNYFRDERLNLLINAVLERELAGYRFVDRVVTDITSETEIKVLEEALADPDFPGVKAHLRRALELLSDRDHPDYRNSIKESISAVESLTKEITSNPKATLGEALKILERDGKLHPALKSAFSQLYGYTSDEEGIRHAMLDEPELSVAEAKFFLLSCTSFINYMKSKL